MVDFGSAALMDCACEERNSVRDVSPVAEAPDEDVTLAVLLSDPADPEFDPDCPALLFALPD
ncbi:MAG: hypothetical protein AAGA08_02040 [Pseudomonadota bacterium]